MSDAQRDIASRPTFTFGQFFGGIRHARCGGHGGARLADAFASATSSEWDCRRALRPAKPAALPECLLWTLTKDGHSAEARTRMIPIGLGRPELRFYVSSRETGEMMLLWSQVFENERQVGELAEVKKKEYEAKGWWEDGPAELRASLR